MQTFLPTPNFEETASVLDQRRLGKQRVETLQIMTTLATGRGWPHHPAVKMWAGFEMALLQYQNAICDLWMSKGFKDTCLDKTREVYFDSFGRRGRYIEPFWLGDDDFHIAHQSNLLRKDPDHYGPIFGDIPDDIPYVWPV